MIIFFYHWLSLIVGSSPCASFVSLGLSQLGKLLVLQYRNYVVIVKEVGISFESGYNLTQAQKFNL